MQNAVANSVNVTTSKAIIARRERHAFCEGGKSAVAVVDVAGGLTLTLVSSTTFSSSFVRRRRSCIAWDANPWHCEHFKFARGHNVAHEHAILFPAKTRQEPR